MRRYLPLAASRARTLHPNIGPVTADPKSRPAPLLPLSAVPDRVVGEIIASRMSDMKKEKKDKKRSREEAEDAVKAERKAKKEVRAQRPRR